MIPAVLAALKFAPAVLGAGREIVGALTGREPPANATPEEVADLVERLPPEERRPAVQHILHAKTRHQELDTARFHRLTEGPADRIRATARPQIALRAMRVVTLFATGISILFALAALDWGVRAFYIVFLGKPAPDIPSAWGLLAAAEPVAELIWVPLLGSFWASVRIVVKYMGCRERDKARADEIAAGRPLESAQASIADAGGAVAGIIHALKGR